MDAQDDITDGGLQADDLALIENAVRSVSRMAKSGERAQWLEQVILTTPRLREAVSRDLLRRMIPHLGRVS